MKNVVLVPTLGAHRQTSVEAPLHPYDAAYTAQSPPLEVAPRCPNDSIIRATEPSRSRAIFSLLTVTCAVGLLCLSLLSSAMPNTKRSKPQEPVAEQPARRRKLVETDHGPADVLLMCFTA